MRYEVDHVEPRDVLEAQQIDGLRLLLAEDRDEHIDRRDFLAAAGLNMEHGALEHALEAQRRLNFGSFVVLAAKPRRRALDELLELATQAGEVHAAGLQRFDDRGRVEQREQQMLHRDELMPLFTRSLERVVQTIFELAR